MYRLTSCALIIGAALSGAAIAAPVNLLVNGDFETPPLSSTSFVTYGSENPAPSGFGWTVIPDGRFDQAATDNRLGVDHIGSFWDGANGSAQSVDIDGSSGLTQSFATVAGQTYSLSFAYSRNPFNGGNPSNSVFLTVFGAGEASTLFSDVVTSAAATQAVSLNDLNYLTYTATFIADGSDATLTFIGTNAQLQANLGFVLDEVSVTALSASDPVADPSPVPLPAGLPLLLAGVGGFAWLRHRQSG